MQLFIPRSFAEETVDIAAVASFISGVKNKMVKFPGPKEERQIHGIMLKVLWG
jgi:hypothetical protein